MLTILSPTGWFKAVVESCDEGAYVEIWQCTPARNVPGGRLWNRVHRETMECPFHVACDLVHGQVAKLECAGTA